MRWRTTISFLTLLFFCLLFLLLSPSSDETLQSSERESGSKDEKKAVAKLYHGMNKRYRLGDEPDMQINITVAIRLIIDLHGGWSELWYL